MTPAQQPRDAAFEDLLDFLRETRGFDYTDYKRPSLMRRFRKRMDAVGIDGFSDYRAFLEAEPREVSALFDTILINVTGFFRDASAWQFVASDVIPRLLGTVGPKRQIRVWSAGCASGEEPYTIAMLFAEAMGEETFAERVKIYATDIDDEALNEARQAVYPERKVEDVPSELRKRYFQERNGDCAFRSDLRRAVIFGRNDLLQDPPISRVDLLFCRNTLMYFGPSAQTRILSNFFFALKSHGFLVLGKAEALMSRSNLFVPHDLKYRIFVKDPEAEAERPRLRVPAPVEERAATDGGDLRAAVFEQGGIAELVLDAGGRVAAINHPARNLFGLQTRDIGRPLQDLELSYRPLELRSLVDKVHAERRALSRKEVVWQPDDGPPRYLDVHLAPLVNQTGQLIGTSVSYTDVTRHRALQDDLEQARRELETAYEELQSTVEELETTNEELQSTNEELETTNEELQSTNEELETMNEELQSTNEELEAMNDEMRDRTDEALRSNAYLRSILASVPQAVVVVDGQLRVTAWSANATELFGLREDEVLGRHALDLDLGIELHSLREPIRHAIDGASTDTVLLAGHDRRGKPITCTVSFAPLTGHDGGTHGAVVVVDAERV